MNPCDNCKKKPSCTERCFPKMDYERGQKKRRRNGKPEKAKDIEMKEAKAWWVKLLEAREDAEKVRKQEGSDGSPKD